MPEYRISLVRDRVEIHIAGGRATLTPLLSDGWWEWRALNGRLKERDARRAPSLLEAIRQSVSYVLWGSGEPMESELPELLADEISKKKFLRSVGHDPESCE
jgi:hypothetical protein